MFCCCFLNVVLQMLFRCTFAGRRFLSTTTRSVSPVHFPYGENNFRSIRRAKKFFGDFSGYIREVETIGNHLIFTRPPRWGKSLFQDMLSVYYDKNTTEEEFHELFTELDICTGIKSYKTDLRALFVYSTVEWRQSSTSVSCRSMDHNVPVDCIYLSSSDKFTHL